MLVFIVQFLTFNWRLRSECDGLLDTFRFCRYLGLFFDTFRLFELFIFSFLLLFGFRLPFFLFLGLFIPLLSLSCRSFGFDGLQPLGFFRLFCLLLGDPLALRLQLFFFGLLISESLMLLLFALFLKILLGPQSLAFLFALDALLFSASFPLSDFLLLLSDSLAFSLLALGLAHAVLL